MKWRLRYSCHYLTVILAVVIVLSEPSDLPSGHMQPLGSHAPPLDVDTLHTPPDPVSFYSKYVKHSRPVKFKGLLKDQEVIKNWQDDVYLRMQFGDISVGVETVKKENRSRYGTAMKFSEFLDRYKTDDLYVVTEVPVEMRNEWLLPSFLLCGGFTEHLSLMYLWFSNGGTKSVLHSDSYENLHCVVSGSKTFVLIEQKFSKVIGPEHEAQGFYNMDVEAVDMTEYPALAEIPWYKVVVEEGDCLYLPYLMLHHVDSNVSRNMGLNVWWIPFDDFNENECLANQQQIPEFASAGDYALAPELEMKWFLLQCKREDGTIHATDVHKAIEKLRPSVSLEALMQAMEIILPNSNGVIHESDLHLDKTPISKYRESMEYLMSLEEIDEDNWEGGGDGHTHARDEL